MVADPKGNFLRKSFLRTLFKTLTVEPFLYREGLEIPGISFAKIRYAQENPRIP